jgi:hypothetical protein
MMHRAFILAAVVSHVAVSAFTSSPNKTSPRTTTHCRSTPKFGDWNNDDFLNSLGGNEQQGNYEEPLQQEQRQVPQNDLTDEEILEMSLRAAQFYNTDTTIEEAYGVRRGGPPRRKEE